MTRISRHTAQLAAILGVGATIVAVAAWRIRVIEQAEEVSALAVLGESTAREAGALASWAGEQYSDAAVDAALVASDVAAAVPGSRAPIAAALAVATRGSGFTGAWLLDPRGDPIVASGEPGVLLASELRAARLAMRDRRVELAGPDAAATTISVIAPIATASGQLRGALVLRGDARQLLAPLLPSRLVHTRTGEVHLLVRGVAPGTLADAMSIARGWTLPDRLTPGRTGPRVALSGIFPGPHHIPALVAVRAVPGTPWAVAETMDVAEVRAIAGARVHTEIALTAVSAALFLFGVAVARHRARTDRIRRLTESEQHYRLLFESNPEPMWVFDPETLAFLAVNDAAVRHYGYSREEFLAMGIDRIRPPEEVPALRTALERDGARGVGGSEAPITRHRTRDGTLLDVAISMDAITFAGRPARLVVARDVTALRRLAQQRDRSRALLAAALESTADGILIVHGDGRRASWNRQFSDLWQVPESLRRTHSARRVTALLLRQLEAPTTLRRRLRELAAHPERPSFDVVRLRDGSTFEVHSQPQRLGTEIVGRVWSYHDLTAREHAMTEWRAMTARFEIAFGNAPIGMIIVAPDGRWLQVNRAMCELLGYTAAELVGRTPFWVTHPDDVAATREHMAAAVRGPDAPPRLEKRYVRKDGRVLWAAISVSIHRDATGAAQYFITQVQDIGARRLFEESLRRQALVFETISEAIIVLDTEGRVVDANPAATVVLGYERDELVGETCARWTVPEGACDEMHAVLARDGEWVGETRLRRRDGRVGTGETVARSLRDAQGVLIANVIVMRDVTARRELERQLHQAQKLEAIGALAAGIAHEINTPTQYVGDNVRFVEESMVSMGRLVRAARAIAAAVRARPALADDAGLAPAVADFDVVARAVDLDYLAQEVPVATRHAREGVDRIAEIVCAVRGLAHPGGGAAAMVDLNATVRSTVIVSRSEWKYVATVTMELDPDLPLVLCHGGEVQQVLLNLIVNAADAITQARRAGPAPRRTLGAIRISTRLQGEAVELQVADDGCGIPDAIRGRVFDPFFTTKPVGKGTGQGLAIAHAAVVRHRGTITFESREGVGTTFIVRLPLGPEPALVAGHGSTAPHGTMLGATEVA